MFNYTETADKLSDMIVTMMGIEHLISEIVDISPLPNSQADIEKHGGYALIAINTIRQIRDELNLLASEILEVSNHE